MLRGEWTASARSFRVFSYMENVVKSACGGKRAPKHDRALDCDTRALAEEWRHGMGGIAEHHNPPCAVLLQRFAVTQAPFEQCSRSNRADELQSGRIKIAIEVFEFVHGCGNFPSFLLPTRLTTDRDDIHNGSMTQRRMEKIPIGANEHGKGRVLHAVRHIRHRHKRTKCHLGRIVQGVVSEHAGAYLRGVAVTSDQYIACKCLSVREPRHDLLGVPVSGPRSNGQRTRSRDHCNTPR